jgi:putative hemolysin
MDSDSSSPFLPAITFIVSFIVFTLAYLAESTIAAVRRERVQRLVAEEQPGAPNLETLQSLPLGPIGSLTLLKYLSLAAGFVSAAVFAMIQVGQNWIAITVSGLIVLGMQLVAYAVVRSISASHGDEIALRAAYPVRTLAWCLHPVLLLVVALTAKFAQPNGNSHEDTDIPVVEIGMALEEDGELLDQREVEMIRGVVELDDTVAREIMIPRVDMTVAEIGMPIGDMAEIMVEKGHSRIPVFRERLDRIEGIAYARDILGVLATRDNAPDILVESILRPALFIPESKSLEDLLSEFQTRRVHMAIVVDEYGGVSGLVTIEDLLEEIVGEILDEFDEGEPEIISLSDTEYMMDARTSIDDLNELLDLVVEGDGFDTLGGFVYQRLGKIPNPGDLMDYDGLKIEVISTTGRRLKRLKVTKPPLESAKESG